MKKIKITENQLKMIIEHRHSFVAQETDESVESYDEECLKDESVVLSEFLGMNLNDEDLGPEMSDQQILAMTNEKNREVMSKILNNLSQMSSEELKNQLNNVISLRNIKEQQTPYMERQTSIAGVNVPTPIIHGVLALVVISILSKIMKIMFQGGGGQRRGGRRRRSMVGCQGGAVRARLVAQRRRRENWKRFLKKIGVR